MDDTDIAAFSMDMTSKADDFKTLGQVKIEKEEEAQKKKDAAKRAAEQKAKMEKKKREDEKEEGKVGKEKSIRERLSGGTDG